jgi:hypothetical protein
VRRNERVSGNFLSGVNGEYSPGGGTRSIGGCVFFLPQHPAFGSFLTKLPLLASDWNTIWEIFHTPETSSLLMRLADQFCVQDLRSERGLMPIHDVGMCGKTRAARCPPAVSVLLLVFLFLIWGHWAGWDFTEPWRFFCAFSESHQIGWHRR